MLLLSLSLPFAPATAQQSSTPAIPIIQPKITVVGSIQDSSGTGALLPVDAGISPNGKLLAYSTRDDVRLINASTGTARVIFEGNVHTFFWGAKGDALGMTHDDPKTGTRDIYVLHLDPVTGVPTGPAVKAALGGVNHGAVLSPDESLIAFAKPVWDSARELFTERAELVVAPANGGLVRTLASAQDLRIGNWSPDGHTIYYKGFPDESSKKRQIFRVPVSGGKPMLVGDFKDVPWPNRFDEAAQRVTAIYAVPPNLSVTDWSNRNPLAGVRVKHPRALRVINIADGTTRDLIDLNSEVGVPEWFANGNRLAIIARRNEKFALLTLNADGSGERSYTLTAPPYFDGVGPRNNAHLQVSPDGRFAAFVGDGRDTIQFLDMVTGAQRTLVKSQASGSDPNGRAIGQLMWSADSKNLRYILSGKGHEVHQVTLDGVDKLALPLPSATYQQTIWFPSDTVASPRLDAGIVEIFDRQHLAIVPLSGGEERTVYRGQINQLGALSPDRRTIAIRDGNGQSVKEVTLVSLDDGGSRIVRHPFFRVGSLAWHPDGQHLLITGREVQGGPTNLYSQPIDGSAPRVLAPVGSTQDESVIAVSADGTLIAVTVGGTPSATFFRLDYKLTPSLGANKQ